MTTTIVVKVKDGKAIVRKTQQGPFKSFGLTRDGEWILKPEGKPYPEQCILPIVFHDDSPTETT